ncbi:MAG: hypothetical protein KAR06_08885, partial [Deltaproteobacteria bacterium]|nr:hypothetical protein [Deltaproteobacteria bacterium]
STSEESAASAEELSSQADALKVMVSRLVQVVGGSGTDGSSGRSLGSGSSGNEHSYHATVDATAGSERQHLGGKSHGKFSLKKTKENAAKQIPLEEGDDNFKEF